MAFPKDICSVVIVYTIFFVEMHISYVAEHTLGQSAGGSEFRNCFDIEDCMNYQPCPVDSQDHTQWGNFIQRNNGAKQKCLECGETLNIESRSS